jgi:hypothetical protein
MNTGILTLVVSSIVGLIAWLLAGATLFAWAVGIATFLFVLLGGFCFASDISADNSSREVQSRITGGESSGFGGRRISGSWK